VHCRSHQIHRALLRYAGEADGAREKEDVEGRGREETGAERRGGEGRGGGSR